MDYYDINDRYFIVKKHNVLFKMIKVPPIEPMPIVYRVSIEDRFNNFKGANLVIPLIYKYFHVFLEVFPRILYLRSKNLDFTVVIVGEEAVDRKTLLFDRMSDAGSNSFLYIKEFLEYFNVPYICVNQRDMDTFSCDEAYFFYYKESNFEDEIQSINKTFMDSTGLDVNQKEYYSKFWSDEMNSEHGYPLNLLYRITAPLVDNIDILAKSFPKVRQKGRKIFISRSNLQERPLNIDDYMAKRGYEVIFFDEMNIIEQIRIVRESSTIAAVSGSAFVNILMCNPNTRVIEISPDKDYKVLLYYSSLKERLGIEIERIEITPDNMYDELDKHTL